MQKNSCLLQFPPILLPTNLGLPLHSPSALTEHVSLNLARFYLLYSVIPWYLVFYHVKEVSADDVERDDGGEEGERGQDAAAAPPRGRAAAAFMILSLVNWKLGKRFIRGRLAY